uniref:Extended synaptotagmin-like protein 2a n=1 Tax=Cyprinus carpio TaxID=7962 RepID=A0A8C2JD45_CYPCA
MSASANGGKPKPAPAVSQNGPGSVPPSPTDVNTLEPVLPDEEPQSAVTDTTQMGIKLAKTFLLIFPIYVLGYLEFSFSWVLIILAVLFWLRRNQGSRFAPVNRALAFLEQEERAVRQSVRSSELPPWVHFPDVERVEWLNKTVHQMWPYICQFVDKLFRETIEPAVQGANAHLSTFTFSKIDMGDKPLRVDGVKVYTENVDRRQIIMDLQISFVGNTEIDVDIKKYYCRAGIKSIQLNGVLRVIMEPLLGDMPLIGALSVFFLKKPLLDINWTGLTNMLDIPGINGLCDSIIQDIIYSYLVLPNKITIPLVNEAQISKLRFPMPKGILRIHFLEAQDLVGKDKFLGGLIKGKSDPYGVIQLGNQLFRSKIIKETVNPKWNEVYEAFVYDHPGQNVEIELYDEDTDKDDYLGSSIKAAKGQANDGLSSALLLVHLDSAKNLPVSININTHTYTPTLAFLLPYFSSGKKVASMPSPFVQFTVGHKSFESKTRYKTNEPVWEEAFTFLIHNPKCQELEVEVKDEKHECSLGTFSLPLSKLLQEDQMTLSQRFPLKNTGPGATLKMKMALRILSMEKLSGSNQLSSIQNHHPSSSTTPNPSPQQANVSEPTPTSKTQQPTPAPRSKPTSTPSPRDSPTHLAKSGRSTSNLAISGSQLHLNNKEPTPSIASDISNPNINSTTSPKKQTNCRGTPNLISSTENGSDPYVRLYLLPDKRRSGRRKTNTMKKTVNPIYDQSFEFSVSLVELHRRTLDVAVKNGGGILSKHRGLLGKVTSLDLTSEDISKSSTQW